MIAVILIYILLCLVLGVYLASYILAAVVIIVCGAVTIANIWRKP